MNENTHTESPTAQGAEYGKSGRPILHLPEKGSDTSNPQLSTSRVRIRMPGHFRADRRRSEAPDAKRDVHTVYGVPEPSKLSQPGVLGSYMDRLLATDKAINKTHRQLVHGGIAMRYQHALDLRDDPGAFAIWIKEPRICGLPRPPKKKEDICRALFRATYANPSDASKRFKRIEFAWKRGDPVEVVAAFLAKRGLQDTKPASGAKEDVDEEKPNARETAGGSDGSGKDLGAVGSRKPGPASNDKDVDSVHTRKPGPAGHDIDVDSARTRKPGPVRIANAPAALIAAKEVGDFIALGGYIESIDGGVFVLRDTWHG